MSLLSCYQERKIIRDPHQDFVDPLYKPIIFFKTDSLFWYVKGRKNWLNKGKKCLALQGDLKRL